jgi:hypothetical protein
VFRIPNTDLAPFALCEFCKSVQTHGEGPHEPLITSLSKFRGPPELCDVRRRVLYKICKKCISRARAPRGRDAWEPLIDIKSDRGIPDSTAQNTKTAVDQQQRPYPQASILNLVPAVCVYTHTVSTH